MRVQQLTCTSQSVSDQEDLSPHLALSREVSELIGNRHVPQWPTSRAGIHGTLAKVESQGEQADGRTAQALRFLHPRSFSDGSHAFQPQPGNQNCTGGLC